MTNTGEIPNNKIDHDGNGYADDTYGYNWAEISYYYSTGGSSVGYSLENQEVAQSFAARVAREILPMNFDVLS